jgi:hypothetical protein
MYFLKTAYSPGSRHVNKIIQLHLLKLEASQTYDDVILCSHLHGLPFPKWGIFPSGRAILPTPKADLLYLHMFHFNADG